MKKILIFFATFSGILAINAQDPSFLNTNQSLVYLNPSFAGTNGYIRNQAIYRNQWPNLSRNYVTYLNTFDAYIKPIKGGLAVSLMTDVQAHGTLKRTGASLTYAQHFSLMDGDLKIIPSLQGTFGQQHLDVNNLHFGEYLDTRYGMTWKDFSSPPAPNKTYFDMSSGLLINYKNLYVGASAFHFNQPDIGMLGTFKLPVLYSFNASYNKIVSERMLLNFSGRFMQQQDNSIGQCAVNMVYKNILAGLGYRSENTGFISAGFRTGIATFMLGYDRGFGKTYSAAGSWELMFSCNVRKDTPKGITTNLENW